MNLREPLGLLGGLTPVAFMRDYWQKRPLLIRGALPPAAATGGSLAPVTPAELFALAARDDVESRLVIRSEAGGTRVAGGRPRAAWRLKQGPFARRSLPPSTQRGWTLLVQGVDLHVQAAHELLQRFRWVSDARVDDLMVSYASPGGGVGAHIDSYDVFLLQVHGHRRWRVGPVPVPVSDAGFVDGLPVRILERFEAAHEWVLAPGDMLYVPPRWGHDGVAEDTCMTCSIGYRAPRASELACELLQRAIDAAEPAAGEPHFRDPPRSATDTPARIPPALDAFARKAVARLLRDPAQLARSLGEAMTEPKPMVWFEPGRAPRHEPGDSSRPQLGVPAGLRLDRRTRMMYDERHVFINGESFNTAGRDARLMRELADARRLSALQCGHLSGAARTVVAGWVAQGWAHDE